MNKITSPQNEYIKQLCRLNAPSGRRESGLFITEGRKLCEEAAGSGWTIEQCLVTEKEYTSPLIRPFEDKTTIISENVAKKLTTMDTAPGMFMVVRQQETAPAAKPRLILALDHLSDPSNLGAILRSAEAFGAEQIVLSEGCVDLFSSKVLRGAMGSVFRLPILRCNLAEYLKEQRGYGYKIYGAGLNRNYLELPELSFDEPSVMIIGNEANGITPEIMNLCDSGVFIPMLGRNESLNAAVAASIILWEQSKWK